MPYYHDANNRIVISAPEQPTIVPRKGKRGASDGWVVWATLEITRADNYTVPGTHQWRYPVMQVPREEYDSRDSRESAIGYFKTFNYPKFPEISFEEYSALRKQYEELAEKNPAPE